MFESKEKKIKKEIDRRNKKLESLKKNAKLYQKLAEQEKEYKALMGGPLKDYSKLEAEKRRKAQERNAKIGKAINIISNHMFAPEEEPKKKNKKVKA
jgi:3-methyladenine DNA glycosylase Tag